MKDKNGLEIVAGDCLYHKECDSCFTVYDLGGKLRINNLPIEIYRQEDGRLIDFEKAGESKTISNFPNPQELDMLPQCCRHCSNNIYNNPSGNGVCHCTLPYLENPIRC